MKKHFRHGYSLPRNKPRGCLFDEGSLMGKSHIESDCGNTHVLVSASLIDKYGTLIALWIHDRRSPTGYKRK
jgi:hypothetical protein